MIRFLWSVSMTFAFAVFASGGSDDLKDPKNWTPFKFPGKQAMPEFADISEWVNSAPLTVKDLKGKVAVVHFMAFG
jgi:hypothetical protein